MCLCSKSNKMLTAENDIICYKFLMRKGERYFTPYVGKRIQQLPALLYGENDFSKECESKSLKGIGESQPVENLSTYFLELDNDECYYEMDKGFIHAFQTKKDCIKALIEYVFWNPYNYVFIVKCIIPKGAGYFKGEFNDICAEKMKVGVEVE